MPLPWATYRDLPRRTLHLSAMPTHPMDPVVVDLCVREMISLPFTENRKPSGRLSVSLFLRRHHSALPFMGASGCRHLIGERL